MNCKVCLFPADCDCICSTCNHARRLYEDDAFTRGYESALEAHQQGIDVTTHRSQGNTPFDLGWNAFLKP